MYRKFEEIELANPVQPLAPGWAAAKEKRKRRES